MTGVAPAGSSARPAASDGQAAGPAGAPAIGPGEAASTASGPRWPGEATSAASGSGWPVDDAGEAAASASGSGWMAPPGSIHTSLGVSFQVTPLDEINGNLATLLGESILDLLGMFYPPQVCKKANVVVTELIQNVVENVVDPASELRLELRIDADALVVRVSNKATRAQYEGVRARIDALTGSPDPKKLFTATLRARRAERLKGGLGLMRLVSENRFRLAASYEHELLTMQATFPLRGSV